MTQWMYIFCLVVWGLNFIAVKIQGTPVSLELSLTYRLVLTALIFGVLIYVIKPKQKPTKNDIPFIIIFGICNFTLSYLLLYYATILSTAALVTLVFSLKVILTPIALRIFLKEPLHPRIFIGGIVGVIGVFVLIYPSLIELQGAKTLMGLGVALMGTIITAIGDASSARNAKNKVDPYYANSIGFAIGSLVMGLIVYFQGNEFKVPLTFSYLGALLYLTLIASVLAWFFYLKLVEKIGGAKSGYMVALFPVVGGAASVFIGESELTIYLLVGCLLTSLGAMVALGISSTQRKGKVPLHI